MKKYILGLALFAGMMLTACDTDNVGTTYTTSAQNISFENAEPNTVVTKASSVSVPVAILVLIRHLNIRYIILSLQKMVLY